MVEWAEGGTFELTEGGVTEPIDPARSRGRPRGLPDVRPLPPTALTVDPDTGELAAPIGALAAIAEAIVALAAAFGGRSVATAEFATREPEPPLALAARPGDPSWRRSAPRRSRSRRAGPRGDELGDQAGGAGGAVALDRERRCRRGQRARRRVGDRLGRCRRVGPSRGPAR